MTVEIQRDQSSCILGPQDWSNPLEDLVAENRLMIFVVVEVHLEGGVNSALFREQRRTLFAFRSLERKRFFGDWQQLCL